MDKAMKRPPLWIQCVGREIMTSPGGQSSPMPGSKYVICNDCGVKISEMDGKYQMSFDPKGWPEKCPACGSTEGDKS